MIGFWTLLVGAVLLLLLLLVAVKGLLTARELEHAAEIPPDDEEVREVLPEEFATRIFSRSDWEFVSNNKSIELNRLFLREREAVALLWLRQTARVIRQVMREHAEAARKSQDLLVTTELKLFIQYGQLLFACGLLFLAIRVAGPVSPAALAIYTARLSRQLSEAHQVLKAATDATQIRAASM